MAWRGSLPSYRVRSSLRPLPNPRAHTFIAGDYTLIVSAFEPKYRGPFTLKLETDNVAELTPIPQEGAGMYATTLRGAW